MASRDWIFQTRSFSKLVGRVGVLRKFAEGKYDRPFSNGRGLFRGVYATFEEAARSAPDTKALGYDQPDAAAMYRDRLDRIYPSDYPMVFWLKTVMDEIRTVFDFGGHVGIARYAYDTYLHFPQTLQWKVCDVQAVAEAGTELARERGVAGLSFTTSREEAAGADLFFSAGALQYLDWRLPDLLATIERPKRLLLNLLPLTDGPTYFTLQNIGTAFCPYRISSRQELLGGLQKLGYQARDSWTNPEKSCYIPFHLDRSLSFYDGFYLTLES